MMLGIYEEKSSKGDNISRENDPVSALEMLKLKVEDGSEVHLRDGNDKMADSSVANICTVKDLTEECVNTNSLVNCESSVKLPMYSEPIPCALHQKHWNNVKLGVRDDDENLFGCSKYSTRLKPFRPLSCTGQHRMKKLMTSKYCKAAPKKDYELYTTRERMEGFYRYSKSIYTRERCKQAPLKKRKLSDRRFAVAYDWRTKYDGISNLSDKADGTSEYMNAHSKAKEHHVAVSINSFKVPELYIEVPESATIGLLKRTVLEAVTSILGGGIRVGMVFQGRKVRGDSKTLQQAGISQFSNLENLGFTLEPKFSHISFANRKQFPVSPSCDADQNIPRFPSTPVIGDTGTLNGFVDPHPLIKSDSVDNGELIIPKSSDDMLIDEAYPETMVLVPSSPMKVEAIAVAPVNQKPKCFEASLRRTRRPFSVGEVEALVEAVERLGTGRWRDVKMRAFENADHRTYVDLKDKWKTLVHTANITPQQRRGEPVPHELLNRVLSAHSYWSQHQSKQHGKPHASAEPLDIAEEVIAA